MARSRSSRSSRSRGRAGRSDRGLHVLGGVLIALALGGFAAGSYYYATANTSLPIDRASLCPLEGPRSTTVILLDSSDALPDVTRRELLTNLTDTAEAVPEYGLLEIRRLEPDVPTGRTVFAKCNPGDGSGLSATTANPEMRRKRWRKEFIEPLERELEGGLAPSPSKTSPILSTLQSIAVDRFTGSRAVNRLPSLTLDQHPILTLRV